MADGLNATVAVPLEELSARNRPTDLAKLETLPTSSYQRSLGTMDNSVDVCRQAAKGNNDEGTQVQFHTLYEAEHRLTKVVQERLASLGQTASYPGKKARLAAAVRDVLECIGEDPDREGLVNTPARYAEALLFFTSGYQLTVDSIANGALFSESHNGMVIVQDIDIYSLCEHHLVPFNGKLHVGYIPNGKIVGLSKIARIAEIYARRLQVQERLTSQVADALMSLLNAHGVIVVVRAVHLCMAMRGIEKVSSSTTTSCALGCFELEPAKRGEFFSLVNIK